LDTLAQKHKDNVSELKRLEQAKNQVEKSLADVNQADRELRQLEANLSADETRHKSIHDAIEKWLAEDTPRLEKLSADLQNEAYALDKRKNLDSLENEIKELDYSEDLFQQAKQLQESLADASRDMSELDRAQAESKSLQDSIEDLDRRIESLTNAVDSHKAQLLKIESAIADLGPAPEHSLDQVEDKLVHLREAVSVKSSDLGAQKQKITAAQQAKEKATELKQESKELSAEIQDLGKLEVAFGRNGVQALLIERAVPQLEDDTNRILRRLTDGILQVKFRTQKELKSRDAMVETLDIIIEDGYGKRPYAMYSGGETYRVNFAIRIALSKLLAHRAGAPLQTLVIDEGFGSQDPDGRQRLIQAINAIKDDFETILVITHIDELKDSFPTKIMVEKGESGSAISIQ
ncbi:MAG: SMC family ATPase, partial [Chloroflexota bacterium]